jgi:hypothetical protein
MSKDNKPQMITINDVEYDTATFTERTDCYDESLLRP